MNSSTSSTSGECRVHQLLVSHEGFADALLRAEDKLASVFEKAVSDALMEQATAAMKNEPVPNGALQKMLMRRTLLSADPKNAHEWRTFGEQIFTNLFVFEAQPAHFHRCCNRTCGRELTCENAAACKLILTSETPIGKVALLTCGFVCNEGGCEAAFRGALQAYLVCDKEESSGVCCHTCGKAVIFNDGVLKVCARCRRVRYCSRDCQIKHWPEHKPECKAPPAHTASTADSK